MKQYLLAFLVGGLVINDALAAPEDGWRPAQTWVLVAGVLRWQDKSLSSFPAKNRKDKELFNVLLQRGVPKEHATLLIDEEASQSKILEVLATIGKKSPPGSTFLFYFAGHGVKDDDGTIRFTTTDYSAKKTSTGLSLAKLGNALKRDFQGKRVLLLADCCYSGGLGQVAADLAKGGFEVLSLTSSEASNESTRNWTFTQSIIDILQGQPLLDRDGDGIIHLDEAQVEVRNAMKYREHQRSGFACHNIPGSWKLADSSDKTPKASTSPGTFFLNEYIAKGTGDDEEIARVVGVKGDAYTVEFYDYSDKRREEHKASALRKIVFPSYPMGSTIMVHWEDDVYEAKVLQVDDGFHLVSYPGYTADWNEWVIGHRIQGPATGKPTKKKPKS